MYTSQSANKPLMQAKQMTKRNLNPPQRKDSGSETKVPVVVTCEYVSSMKGMPVLVRFAFRYITICVCCATASSPYC